MVIGAISFMTISPAHRKCDECGCDWCGHEGQGVDFDPRHNEPPIDVVTTRHPEAEYTSQSLAELVASNANGGGMIVQRIE
jgi:hypothetical protein